MPGDVSVIGFDNWEIVAAATRPPLSTIDMNLKELGREAGRLVLELAEGKRIEPGLRRLPCKLVVRQSCGGADLSRRRQRRRSRRFEMSPRALQRPWRRGKAAREEETQAAWIAARGPQREDIMQFTKLGLLAGLAWAFLPQPPRPMPR